MKIQEVLPYRVPVLAESDYSFRFWMKGSHAFQALKDGRAEEIHNDAREFVGIILRDKAAPLKPQFHRPSLDSSDTAISDETSFQNAGYFFPSGPEQPACESAHEIVVHYPEAHDTLAVVICAGTVHGAKILSHIPETMVTFA